MEGPTKPDPFRLRASTGSSSASVTEAGDKLEGGAAAHGAFQLHYIPIARGARSVAPAAQAATHAADTKDCEAGGMPPPVAPARRDRRPNVLLPLVQHFQAVGRAIRMRPSILVISLLLAAVIAALGATGVLLAARADEQRRRATAQGAALDVAAAIQTRVLQMQEPLLAVSVMVRGNPQVGAALRLFNSYAQELLDGMQGQDTQSLLVDIRLSPQAVISAIVPPNSIVSEGALGLDLLTDPVRREGVLTAVRTGRVVAKGPALIHPEDISALIVGLPVFIDNVTNPNETFGARAPATDCPPCYNPATKRRFWGMVGTVVDLRQLLGTGLPGSPTALPLPADANATAAGNSLAAAKGAGRAGGAADARTPEYGSLSHPHHLLLPGLAQRGYHYALLAPQRDGSVVRITNAPAGGPAAPVNATVDMPGYQQWTLLVAPAAGWAPAWRDALVAMVVCLAAAIGKLVLGLLVKRAEQAVLMEQLKVANVELHDEKGRARALLGRQMNLIQVLMERGVDAAASAFGGGGGGGGGGPPGGGPSGGGAGGAAASVTDDAPRSARDKIEDLRRAVGALPGKAADAGEEAPDDIQLQDLLGEGAFGKVYRGWWRGTQVAVKVIVLPARMSGTAKRQRMAIMEAAISSAMAHPNIVQTYTYVIKQVVPPTARTLSHSSGQQTASPQRVGGAGTRERGAPQEGGSPVAAAGEAHPLANYEVSLVLEYCALGTLRDALDAHAFTLSPGNPGPCGNGTNYAAVLDTALDVCRAMLHLHRQNVLHSDLKARNVLLKADGGGRCAIAKVADFGLSMHMDAAATHLSYCQGTLTHMAPETLLHHRVSKAGDVFAFGILLYELYSGARVHKDTPMALLGHKVSVEGLRPSFPLGVPAAYKALAEACWAQDAAKRPTFESALDSLASMRAGLPGRTPPLQAAWLAACNNRASDPACAPGAHPGADPRAGGQGGGAAGGGGGGSATWDSQRVRLVVYQAPQPFARPSVPGPERAWQAPGAGPSCAAPLSDHIQAFSLAGSFNTRRAKRLAAAGLPTAAAAAAPPAAAMPPAPAADAGGVPAPACGVPACARVGSSLKPPRAPLARGRSPARSASSGS